MLKTVYTKQLYTRTRSILRPPRRPCDEADKNIFVPEIKYFSAGTDVVSKEEGYAGAVLCHQHQYVEHGSEH